MKNSSKARSYSQCFICREWSWSVSRVFNYGRVELCLPCYVDVLEVRQARGVMGEPSMGTGNPEEPVLGVPGGPGNSPSPYGQLGLFDA